MNGLNKLLCAAVALLSLLNVFGCEKTDHGAQGDPTAGTSEVIHVDETSVATPVPLDTPETFDTPEPTATPFATRAPIEGDVCTDRFPDYDTGADADWSYQSDELRIAIKKHEDEEYRQVYYVADIWMRNISRFRIGSANGAYGTGREDPEDFAVREHAIFGISGTMNAGFVARNGEKHKNVEKRNVPFRSGVVVVYRDGSVKMRSLKDIQRHGFDYKKEDEQNGGVWQGFQFGPLLVQDGERNQSLRMNGTRHPRIIFGYYEPGHYVAVAVDGRSKKAVGMSEGEMAELMESLGVQSAINMDGGTSAVMLFMGKTINVPSGKDRDGDGIGGRNIADLLMFAEYDEEGNAADLSEVTPDKFAGNKE